MSLKQEWVDLGPEDVKQEATKHEDLMQEDLVHDETMEDDIKQDDPVGNTGTPAYLGLHPNCSPCFYPGLVAGIALLTEENEKLGQKLSDAAYKHHLRNLEERMAQLEDRVEDTIDTLGDKVDEVHDTAMALMSSKKRMEKQGEDFSMKMQDIINKVRARRDQIKQELDGDVDVNVNKNNLRNLVARTSELEHKVRKSHDQTKQELDNAFRMLELKNRVRTSRDKVKHELDDTIRTFQDKTKHEVDDKIGMSEPKETVRTYQGKVKHEVDDKFGLKKGEKSPRVKPLSTRVQDMIDDIRSTEPGMAMQIELDWKAFQGRSAGNNFRGLEPASATDADADGGAN
ncbi:hypothetical protein BDV96DRAFT_681169 [Lophiotrema nucula]|uniref:Uncharacterized protein n=1 Tax=Lophiotrema nucula TaxID=690887 RepID=A0A6A5ZTR9_9PLEO|nr:hypothetical protein BDV96DRAFT_681169 [Lophiotrema nucula]